MSAEAKSTELPADSPSPWKARYTLGVLGMLGLLNTFAMRVDLSVAIVAMVNQTAMMQRTAASADWETDTCPGELADLASGNATERGEFLWGETKQAQLLAAFFYGYAAGHIPCGAMADRFGGKLVLGIGIFINGLFTVLTPLLARYSADALFVGRLLLGLSQAGQIPAYQNMVSKWVPVEERSRFSIVFFGSYVGIVLSMALTGVMSETSMGWPLAFYFFGGVSILWCVPWFLLVFDSPAKHPRIDPQERAFLEASLGASSVKKRPPTPWLRVACCLPLWACTAFMTGLGIVYNLLLTALPLYLANIMHFDMRSNGLLSAVPYICGGVGSLLFGRALDLLVTRGCITRMNGFRLFAGIALVIPSLLLVAAALVGCNSAAVVVLMAINCLCTAAHFASLYNNIMALAPNYAGTLIGIVNTFSNATGIVVPYVVAAFTAGNQTRTAWNTVFYLFAAIGVASYCFYLLFATDKEQTWNNPSEETVKKEGVVNTAFKGDDEVERGRQT